MAQANTRGSIRPERRRDEPFQDQYRGGAGQSYRPGGARSPPPARPAIDSYRARSPPRRTDFIDSYRAPPRPRSRTPPPRREEPRRRSPSPARYRDGRDVRGDSYRGRPRSPPPPPARREELPRDDLFRREPPAREYGRDERDFRDGREYGRDERERPYGGAVASAVPRYRERSPLPVKRAREPSPIDSRGRRTPPPKRERIASPPRARYDEYPPARAASPPRRRYSPDSRDRRPASPPRGDTRDYRPRSRSPPARTERVDPRAVDDWRRPRSPSPARYGGRQADFPIEDAGRDSVATSRRSSPPVHPSRLALQTPAVDERTVRAPPARDPYEREPFRAAEAGRRRESPPRQREREVVDHRNANAEDRVPPPREPYRADNDVPPQRAPPAGPAGYRAPSTSMAPPSGPAAAVPVSISAHQRAPAAPPSGPRGAMAVSQGAPRGDFGAPRGRGGFRGDFRGGFGGPPFRGGGRGGAAAGGPPPGFAGRGGGNIGSGRETAEITTDFTTPAGPRSASFTQQSPASAAAASSSSAGPQGFRPSSNSTATTYPRSQRFAPNGQPIPDWPSPSQQTAISPGNNGPPSGPRGLGSRRPTEPNFQARVAVPAVHPALTSLPKPIPDGGAKAAPLVDTSRLSKLQDEAEKLRLVIEQKEARKRKGVREWGRLEREVRVAGLRGELAESAVRGLEGEGGLGEGGFGEGGYGVGGMAAF